MIHSSTRLAVRKLISINQPNHAAMHSGVCVRVSVWCSGCVLGSGPEVLEFKPYSGNFSI